MNRPIHSRKVIELRRVNAQKCTVEYRYTYDSQDDSHYQVEQPKAKDNSFEIDSDEDEMSFVHAQLSSKLTMTAPSKPSTT